MDNGSSVLPIIVGIIIFVIKIMSDANKKQKQNESAKRSPSAQRSTGPRTGSQTSSTDWEQSRTNDNEYRSLDPSLVPKDIPDVDYDKMSNVSVTPSLEEEKTMIFTSSAIKSESKRLTALKEQLHKKGTVKELFLLTEIFNKPKAHNRWQRSIH
jgi:hypothetical protein